MRKVFSIILSAAMALSLLSVPVWADEETGLTAEATSNTNDQSYSVYASTVKSYLADTDEGLMRVEYTGSTDDGVVVEYYDSNYQMISQNYISFELSIFGGFYEGEDAYYLVFGQNNSDEDDSAEVVRVVKYSKDWERLGAASLYGANTTIPFRSGSLRMAECNGYLYIRTSHQMYTSTDGLKHQANLMIEVQESDMTISDSYYSVMNNSVGYVSHSFNQFILVDDDSNLVALDHGDAYPRAAILSKYAKQAGNSTFSGRTSYVNVFSFEGTTGTNSTGASLGGLEYSSTSYLAAGNSVTQDDDWSSHTARNVFVAVTSRSDFSSDGTEIKWITEYDTDGSISASTPQLVKLDTDQFLLLWTTTEYDDSSITASKQVMLHYVYLDEDGDMTSEIYTTDGQLSDCKPVVVDGAAVWYVTGDSSGISSSAETTPVFYKITSDGTCTIYPELETPEITGISATDSGIEVTWNAVAGAEGYYVHYNSSTVTLTDAGTTSAVRSASSGSTYYIWVEAYAGSSKSLVSNKRKFIYIKPELTNTSTGIQVDWPEVTDASEYQIYKETGDDSWSLVQTTADTSWTDQNVSSGSVFTYMIRTVLTDGTIYDSAESSVTYLSVPTLLGATGTSSGIEVSWETVEGAASYRVYYKQSAASSYSSRSVTAGSDSTQSLTLSLTSGAEYVFYVAAYADGSLSGGSGTTAIYYLKAPTVTLSNSSTGIQLSWSEISGAEEYKIYRKTEEDSYSLVDTTTNTEWLDTDVTSGTAYTYQVYTCSGDYVSAGSTEKTQSYLSIPTLLSVENTGNGVEVTWETVGGATTYRVYYKLSTADSYSKRYVSAGSENTQSVTLSLTGGESYDIYVAAYADGILSDGSETMTIYYLETPTVTLSKDSTGIQLSWGGVTGAEGYKIYRRTGEGSYSLMGTSSETSWTDTKISGGVIYTYQVYAYSGDSVSSGSAEVSNTITDITSCTITLSADSFTYDGTEKKPDVTVRNNGLTLTEGTDYTVSFSNNVNAGTANVVITGEGDYVGTQEKTFTINKASQSLTASISAGSITVGDTATITASGTGSITYSSGNTGVATVNSSGVVTGVGAGTATITVSAAATDNYYAAQTAISVTVTAADSGDTGSGDTGSGDSGSDDSGSGDTGSGDSGSGDSGSGDTGSGDSGSGGTDDSDSSTDSTAGDTLMVRRGNTCYFNYTLKGGSADFIITVGESTDGILVGDWDGDGIDTICLRRGNKYYFIDDITTMNVYLIVYYGKSTDEVLVGDWDGDGCDSLAMRRDGNRYYFCNDITDPNSDTWMSYYGRRVDQVLVGDWEGRGYDSLAVRRDGNCYYFSLAKVTYPDGEVWKTYFGKSIDEVLVGDWDNNGTDTLAMRRNGNLYYISNSIADPNNGVEKFYFGKSSDTVYAGKWK